jgi:hypothetical protein
MEGTMDHMPVQDLMVYQAGDRYYLRGQIDGEVLATSQEADRVLSTAVEMLESAGGVIALQRGRYHLSRPVRLGDDVWLKGAGRATQLVVDGEAGGGIGLICERGRGMIISDLAVIPAERGCAEAGLVIDDTGDCQVRDVLVQGFARYGIWMRNNTFLSTIKGCVLADNGAANLYLDHLAQGGRGGDFVPNLVSDCTLYGGGTGIECNHVIVLNIVGCVVFQPDRYAYHLHDTSNSVLISGCRSFQTGSHAVLVESTHEFNATGNIFCWHRGHGMVLRDVSWGAVNGNEFIDQGVRTVAGSLMHGVVLENGTQGVQMVGNTIFNWGDQCPMAIGIQESADCRNNVIAHNNVNYFEEAGVASAGEGTQVAANLTQAEPAYQGARRAPYPDFDRSRLEGFIID